MQGALTTPAGRVRSLRVARTAGLAGLAIAILLLPVWAQVSTEVGVYWAIGLAFGFILQRSRFCFAGAFRDLWLARDGRLMRAVILGLLVATTGFTLLMARFVPDPSFGDLPPKAHIMPVGLHLVVGGLAFGTGMVLAGGCVSGTLFRIGEGYVASWVTLGGILLGLAGAAHTWNWWWTVHISRQPAIWLPRALGFGWSAAVVLAALGALYVAIMWWESRDGMPFFATWSQTEPPPTTFTERLAAIWRTVFVHGWPAAAGGVALGVLNIMSYAYNHPLGVTGELSAWSDRLFSAVGLGAGHLLGTDQFAGCNLVSDGGGLITSSLTLDAGLIAGSLVAALLAGEFKLRFPQAKIRYLQSLGGGVLMGYGAGLALGCTIGAFFSAIPSLALSGWVFGASLCAGAFLGVQAIKRLP